MMRHRAFKAGWQWGWLAACCLSVSSAFAQNEPSSPTLALTWADTLYGDGMAALAKENWIAAVINFEKLQWLQPDYANLDVQREHAWKKLIELRAQETAAAADERNKTIFSVGLACLALLGLGGIVAAWPHAQAYCRLRRGDEQGAAQIYEKILQNHPQRVRLYPPLAGIYLRQGREDDPAMRVYKTILRLNLAAANRREINRVVAQKYLALDFTDEKAIKDDDIIPVLEEALKAVHPLQAALPHPQKRMLAPLNPRYV